MTTVCTIWSCCWWWYKEREAGGEECRCHSLRRVMSRCGGLVLCAQVRVQIRFRCAELSLAQRPRRWVGACLLWPWWCCTWWSQCNAFASASGLKRRTGRRFWSEGLRYPLKHLFFICSSHVFCARWSGKIEGYLGGGEGLKF